MLLILDLETGGTNQNRNPILQIGACWAHREETFHRYVRQAYDRPIVEADALKVNGEVHMMLDDPKRTPEPVAIGELLGWVRSFAGMKPSSVVLGGWNIHFDHRFILDAIQRAGLSESDLPFRHNLVDVHSLVWQKQAMCRELQPPADAALYGEIVRGADHACQLLDLPKEERPHHGLKGALHARSMLKALGIPHIL